MTGKKLTILLAVAWIAAFAVSCSNHASDRLTVASQLVDERPDSAYIILKDIDYNTLSDGKDKALYGLVHARANMYLGRSLVSDTILPYAIQYYEATADTSSLIDACIAQARHLRAADNREAAFGLIDSLSQMMPANIRWQLNQELLDYSFADKDHETALDVIARQIALSESAEERIEFEIKKITPLLSLNRVNEALKLCDSIQSLPDAPAYGSGTWLNLQMSYAAALSEKRETSAKAADILENILKLMDGAPDYKVIELYIPLINLHLNAGSKGEAEKYLTKIEASGIDLSKTDPVAASYLELLKIALEYEKNGVVSLSKMSPIAHSLRKVNTDLEAKKRERDEALEAAYDLSRSNYELTIRQQRMWIIIILVAFAGALGVAVFWYTSYRRRKRLIEAEDRIETLEELLKSANNPATDRKQGLLKRLLLQQLGIMKTFAESPTTQNQEALRKISNIGNSDTPIDSLVKWDDLYPVIDELYDNFHGRISREHPELSEREVQIICLMRAGFSTKEIGVLIQQTSNSIYVSKTSIRKKLGLQPKEDFMEVLTGSAKVSSEA